MPSSSPSSFAIARAAALAGGACSLSRVARRFDPGPSAERRHLEARVLADRPAVDVRPSELGLRPGVLLVRRAGLRRPALRIERLDRPAGQQPLELARLVRVP